MYLQESFLFNLEHSVDERIILDDGTSEPALWDEIQIAAPRDEYRTTPLLLRFFLLSLI